MAMEVSCGDCQGRLLVESPGAIVACPHCGSHLSTPQSDSDLPTPDPAELRNYLPFLADPPTMIASGVVPGDAPVVKSVPSASVDNDPDFDWMTATTPPLPATYPNPRLDSAPPESNEAAETVPSSSGENGDDSTTTNFHFEPSWESEEGMQPVLNAAKEANNEKTPSTIKKAGDSPVPDPNMPPEEPNSTLPVFSELPISAPSSAFAKEATRPRQALLTVPLIVVGTYASLLTLYVVYKTLFDRTHQLESLPDLKTVQQQGGRAVVPGPENKLPPGHELRLGETQRYGDIRVTPMRITRGPLAFTHYSGDATRERDPTDPVLKLWLKFENVSDRQIITPIDATLMYFQRSRGKGEIASYNVIFPATDLRENHLRYFYHFEHIAVDSEWLIVGQNTNRALAPHESYETFVPSEEHIEGLSGDLVWRVHIRKGNGPKTGNGVTTLIDVHFRSDEILPDSV